MNRGDEAGSIKTRKPLRSGEVPDLNDLAQTCSEVPVDNPNIPTADAPEAPPAAQAKPAKPAKDEAPKPPERPALALELKVAVHETSDDSDDVAGDVDEEAATKESQAVAGEPEVKTSLYNPSVANLLGRLTEQEVAAVENPLVAGTRQMINEIENSVADIKLLKHASASKEEREAAVVNAQLIADDAALLLEALPDDAEVVSKLREELLSLYGMYTQLVEELTPKTPVARKPKPKDKPLHTEEREAIQDFRRSNRRRNILIGVVLLVAAGRGALLFVEEDRYTVEQQQRGATNVAINHAAGATEEQLSVGIPSVVEVYLNQEASGALRARALPLDPDGDPVTLTYRWLAEDRVVEIEQHGLLPAGQVKGGVAYAVRVTASDGKHESAPVTTIPLVAGRPQQ
jgi:hypothetical protein